MKGSTDPQYPYETVNEFEEDTKKVILMKERRFLEGKKKLILSMKRK
jgi:hypothetical protein